MKRRVRKRITRSLSQITDAAVGTLTDFTLLSLYSFISAMGPRGRTMYSVVHNDEVFRWLDRYNYQTIKAALYRLTKHGLIRRSKKRTILEVAITELGKKRLTELLPMYHVDRPWDGHFYLISYDIPSSANHARDLLREHIRKTGGALLQDSLWINPYNPSDLLNEFVAMHNIPGTVLVSRLGSDGAIGEEKIHELIRRVYQLDTIADRYDALLEKYSSKNILLPNLLIDYAEILKTDPQLPFALEPRDFPAKEAYDLYRTFFPSTKRR